MVKRVRVRAAALCVAVACVAAGCDSSPRNAARPSAAVSETAAPDWPMQRFLTAESQRASRPADARAAYRALVEWAANDPYKDGWGGSSLAAFALWRWLGDVASSTPIDTAEARKALELAERLRTTRLVRGLFFMDDLVLETVPQLEEDLERRAAALAWKIDQREDARRFFLRYLEVAHDAAVTPAEQLIMDDLVASGLASKQRLLLLRGRRLRAFGRYEDARTLLREAYAGEDREARAAAGLALAKVNQVLDPAALGAGRGAVTDLLARVIAEAGNPDVEQDARFTRALALKREGQGQDVAGAERELKAIIEEFPRGRAADNAIYELARQAEDRADTTGALALYDRLRKFEGPNDWIDSAHFRPALLLYTRGNQGDAAEAARLLHELVEKYPSGPFRLKALFWEGRIAQEIADPERARARFDQVVRESPYDFYALRARLWRRLGREARRQLSLDAESREELRTAYRRGPSPPSAASGVYRTRLKAAVDAGAYRDALGVIARLREKAPDRRLEDQPLDALDRGGVLPQIAVLFALRQDAIAAADTGAEDRVAVATIVGHGAQDWPLAIGLLRLPEDAMTLRSAVQRDPHFLGAAYPAVFADDVKKSARAYGVAPPLVYATMREESHFNPAALSPRGALGLFQFTPVTFAALNTRWHLIDPARGETREAFLLAPARSIDLGARWLGEELLKRQQNDVMLAVMEHNAGAPAVRAWAQGWNQVGRRDDVEYRLETIRFVETHLFTRRLLTDLAIAEAVGLLDEPAGGTK